jgi:L-cysteate sulfo-lyase
VQGGRKGWRCSAGWRVTRWLSACFGLPTDAMFEAVRLIARSTGLLLDPVYGGKAIAGLIAEIRNGDWRSEEPLLFILTGGLPGLFAYEPAFRPE